MFVPFVPSYLGVECVAASKLLAEAGQGEVDLIVVSKVVKSLARLVAGKSVASEEKQQQGHNGRQLELHDV